MKNITVPRAERPRRSTEMGPPSTAARKTPTVPVSGLSLSTLLIQSGTPGSRTQISAGSASNAAWSADGRTLYYIGRTAPGGPSSIVTAVDMTSSATLAAGKPRELFRRPESQRCGILRCYDISADGSRFLFHDRTSVKRETVSRMDLVLNWTSTLAKGR